MAPGGALGAAARGLRGRAAGRARGGSRGAARAAGAGPGAGPGAGAGALVGPLPAEGRERVGLYVARLLEANRRMNLTGARSEAEALERHAGDSLALLPVLEGARPAAAAQAPARVLDVGSGAGLPGMVLAIARPEWELTLLDSLQKRCRFLEEAARELGLRNVDVRWGRAEDLAREPGLRDGFDLVTARAVAEMATLVELCLPFARPGAGALVAAKGPGPGDEVARAAAAIEALGGAAPKVVPVDSFSGDGQRFTAVVVQKASPTPNKYPRRAGLPNKRPLA